MMMIKFVYLFKKAFSTIILGCLNSRIQEMGKEISFQWDCHQALSKSFYGWKMETCTGSYLKKGLYQLAYADSPNDSQEKNEL
jgi:hypothetical protein